MLTTFLYLVSSSSPPPPSLDNHSLSIIFPFSAFSVFYISLFPKSRLTFFSPTSRGSCINNIQVVVNHIIMHLIHNNWGRRRFCFSILTWFLEQCENHKRKYDIEEIHSLRRKNESLVLAATNCVSFVFFFCCFIRFVVGVVEIRINGEQFPLLIGISLVFFFFGFRYLVFK